MRGDEPSDDAFLTKLQNISPACAGMNRSPCLPGISRCYKPRMRGDEPMARDGIDLSEL